jgi:hypothetical protein
MSKINGEKARAAIAKRRRTAQRAKDRLRRASLTNPPAKKAASSAPKS